MVLSGKLYLVEYYTSRNTVEAGYFVARNDTELVEDFEDSIKSLQMLGMANVLGFHDSEADDDESVAEPENK